MKTLLALSFLVLSIISSLIMPCVAAGSEDPEYVKMLSAHLSVLDMVNKNSFLTESAGHDGVESIGTFEALHSSRQNIPYAPFFQESSSVQKKTKNKPLADLAGKVMAMIASLGPAMVPWGDWLSHNDSMIKDCLELAHEAFDSEVGCNEEERLWAVGILGAILKYLPPDEDNMTAERKFQAFDWSNQVNMEIQAAKDFESYMSPKFKSIVQKDASILGLHTSPELKERLTRAEIFGKFDERRKMESPCLQSDIYKIISTHLLKTKLPDEKAEVGKLMDGFRSLFKQMLLSGWEGDYALELLQHLIAHSPSIQNTFHHLLQDYEYFRDMHMPFAKNDVEEILKTHEHDLGTYFGIIKDRIRQWKVQVSKNPGDVDLLWRMFEQKFDLGTDIDNLDYIYKLMVDLALINGDEEKALVRHFTNYASSMSRQGSALRKIWLALWPDGCVKEAKFGEYQWSIFMKDPSLLQIAKIHQTATEMANSMSHSVQQLGIFLVQVTKNSGHEMELIFRQCLTQVFVNLRTLDGVSTGQNIYKMDLESIHHLIKYKQEFSGIFLKHLESSKNDRILIRTAIMHMIKKGIVKNDLVKTEITDSKGVKYVPHSHFGQFLTTLLDMIDKMNMPKNGRENYEGYAQRLGEKFDKFKLSIGGHLLEFEFKPPQDVSSVKTSPPKNRHVSTKWT
ncbi:hypothetical protein DFH28DRAFT_932157 [Melampsora americana]|nr:hypothetical protein DFH28DRAFT_932157 [Melampsora americana]